ncbi:MAG: esterase-like activity of phytase family protein [Gordonia sp. (in: high G+C Gram-positive bacteria)]|nr:MAG: esterase-like activity of phytase family protein [Gordonia sp. (in: high G+C Gram-positive bacteria)]
MAHDPRAARYLALADRTPTTALIWPLAGLDELPVAQPRVAGPPIRLHGRDGRAIPGKADTEGLAVLADGRLAVSFERGPAISVFDRDGRWRDDLAIPSRFRVTPLGQAVRNGTLEGLTATPAGDRLVAAMEKPLTGDDPGTLRMLDYRRTRAGRFVLARELVYLPAPGMRVAEIAAYGPDRLVVLEAAYSRARGNSVVLTTANIGPPAGRDWVRRLNRRVLADLAQCPTLGAPTRETQRNPLLDNYEGMAVSAAYADGHTIHLVVDDNHSPRQTTRLLTLWARLP